MNPLNLSKTHTTKFILPMAFNEDTKHNKVLTTDFLDSYIAIYDKPEHDDHICIRYDTVSEDEEFEIHKVPDKWADDYVKLLAGKYSEISEEYKQRLLQFWDENSNSRLYQVLYKDKEAVRDRELELENDLDFSKVEELWMPPDISREIYGLGAL